MNRENGFYWVQVIKGTWEVVEFCDGYWYISQYFTPTDSELYAIHAERLNKPDYQP